MVWLNRSPIPVGEEGGNFLVQMTKGEEVGTLWHDLNEILMYSQACGTPGPEGGKPSPGRRPQHQDCGLWFLEFLQAGGGPSDKSFSVMFVRNKMDQPKFECLVY